MYFDWQDEFHKKDEYLKSLYAEVSPYEFYRELFPAGSTARKDEVKANKGNIIACRFTQKGDGKHMTHFNIGNDLTEKELQYVLGYKGSYITPVSYFGKSRNKAHSHLMFAIVLDVDLVAIGNLRDLVYQYSNPNGYYMPEPSFIVNSSKGVHLYYLLKEPYKLEPARSDFENRMTAIKSLKKAMMWSAWNKYTSEDPERDAANIWQIFRAVGSLTKFDDGTVVSAYRVSDRRFDFDELRELFHADHADQSEHYADLTPLHQMTKAEYDKKVQAIKEKYPGYYQRVIVEKQPPKKQDCFDFPPQMYEKWVERARSQGREGHRYFCIKVLFATAIKCNIPRKKALEDALSLVPILDGRTKEKEHFTKDDVMAAYREAYESGTDKSDLMHRLPTKWIIENTAIDLPITKRNGQPQDWHLEDCRQKKASMKKRGQAFKNPEGRPSKTEQIRAWREAHPAGRKADCIRETGISKPTVLKWWGEE